MTAVVQRGRVLGGLLVGSWMLTGVASALPASISSSVVGSEWQEEIVEEHDFDVAEGGTLDVDVADADVDVRVSPADRVEVVVKLRSRDLEWARSLLPRAELRVENDGDRVRIRSSPFRTGPTGRRGWQLLVMVRIPERFDLSIETGDGDVRIERVLGEVAVTSGDGDLFVGRAEGERLELDTADGDVVAKELVYSRIDVETGDGDLQVVHLVTSRARLETTDGDIGVAESSGPLRARSGDGDVAVGLLEAAEISLATGDGDILVKAPSGLAITLQLSGEEVVLKAPDEAFEGRTTEGSVKGTLNGGGPRLSAISSDGQVTMVIRD